MKNKIRNIIYFISLVLSMFIFNACAFDTYPSEDVDVIITYGRPYYYNNTLQYYFYNGYYFYPYTYNDYFYYHRYNRPLPQPRHNYNPPRPPKNTGHNGNFGQRKNDNPQQNSGNRSFGNGSRRFGSKR